MGTCQSPSSCVTVPGTNRGVGDALVNYCRDLKLALVAADEPHKPRAEFPFLDYYDAAPNLIRLHGATKPAGRQGPKDWRGKPDPVPILGESELTDWPKQFKNNSRNQRNLRHL